MHARPSLLLVNLIFGLSCLLQVWRGIPETHAADHMNLEEGLPTQIEDAYPIAYRGREIQGFARYERTDDGRDDRAALEPRLEVGAAPNLQVSLSTPLLFGSADRTGSRNLDLGALYNFNTESLRVPAFALAARAEFPTGINSNGVDTTLKFIATKTLGGYTLQRVHLNAAWLHNAGRRTGERGDRYSLVLGYNRALTADLMFVTDYVREQEREKEKTADILEAGVRYQLTPLTVLAAGAGAGIGEDSPEVRLTVAFQYAF